MTYGNEEKPNMKAYNKLNDNKISNHNQNDTINLLHLKKDDEEKVHQFFISQEMHRDSNDNYIFNGMLYKKDTVYYFYNKNNKESITFATDVYATSIKNNNKNDFYYTIPDNEMIGTGSYGSVYSGITLHHKGNKLIQEPQPKAIKKQIFAVKDQEIYSKRNLNEIKIMKMLSYLGYIGHIGYKQNNEIHLYFVMNKIGNYSLDKYKHYETIFKLQNEYQEHENINNNQMPPRIITLINNQSDKLKLLNCHKLQQIEKKKEILQLSRKLELGITKKSDIELENIKNLINNNNNNNNIINTSEELKQIILNNQKRATKGKKLIKIEKFHIHKNSAKYFENICFKNPIIKDKIIIEENHKMQMETVKNLIPHEQKLSFIVNLFFSINALHYFNIIHNDISLGNIICDEKNHNSMLFIDLGFACVVKDNHRKEHPYTGGTHSFLSPEIHRSIKHKITMIFDNKTDIFSLGCVIHLILGTNTFVEQLIKNNTKEELTSCRSNAYVENEIISLDLESSIIELLKKHSINPKDFTALMESMTKGKPSSRPNAEEALHDLVQLFSKETRDIIRTVYLCAKAFQNKNSHSQIDNKHLFFKHSNALMNKILVNAFPDSLLTHALNTTMHQAFQNKLYDDHYKKFK